MAEDIAKYKPSVRDLWIAGAVLVSVVGAAFGVSGKWATQQSTVEWHESRLSKVEAQQATFETWRHDMERKLDRHEAKIDAIVEKVGAKPTKP